MIRRITVATFMLIFASQKTTGNMLRHRLSAPTNKKPASTRMPAGEKVSVDGMLTPRICVGA